MSKDSIPIDFELFEKVMVYNALTDSLYLENIIEHVKTDYFKNKNVKSVFESLVQYFNAYDKIPNSTELKTHITDPEKREALKKVALSFADIDKKYDKEVLLRNTERFLKEKAVLSTVIRTNVEVQSGSINTEKILEDFEEACGISLVESMGHDYLEDIDKHCEELQKTTRTLSTGWKWLDDNIGGGFLADGRALYVFYGVTNVGKSIFLGNIATNILAQNKTVVLLSLEMSEQMYAGRISAQLSQIPKNDLPQNIQALKDEINSYKSIHKNSKLIIKEFPPQTVTPLQIKVYLEKLQRKGIKPDAIVIDYLNLIAPPEKGMNSYESIKKITEYIRALSYKFECPVISATQTNRSAYNESNPGLETTSESMGLAHTADAQFAIWQETDDVDMGIIRLGISKNRFGKRGVVTELELEYPTLTIKDPSNTIGHFPSRIKSDQIINAPHTIADTLNAIENLDIGDDN
jgi:replicative DNA helicase